jgi:hypothetical protein
MSNKSCPIVGCGFCWKNPVHVVLFLAVLPFALKGINVLWSAVQTAVTALTN